jgi:hypothetical protein
MNMIHSLAALTFLVMWCQSGLAVSNELNARAVWRGDASAWRLTLINPCVGILTWNEGVMHIVKDIHGTPLKTGILANWCADVGRISAVDGDGGSHLSFADSTFTSHAGPAVRDLKEGCL